MLMGATYNTYAWQQYALMCHASPSSGMGQSFIEMAATSDASVAAAARAVEAARVARPARAEAAAAAAGAPSAPPAEMVPDGWAAGPLVPATATASAEPRLRAQLGDSRGVRD
jgi:hypothetical protein